MTPSTADTVDTVLAGRDLTGLVVVITGATSGLGRESARALALAGAHVVLLGRSARALTETAAAIRTLDGGARLTEIVLDLGSLDSVRGAAAEIQQAWPTIDVLMNNAGVMFTPFQRTVDGFETQLGINHFGHFALTRLLTPQLAAAGRSRVITLSSGGHTLGDVDLDDPNWHHRSYDKFEAYGASKTANILFTVALRERLGAHGVNAFAVHPGAVATSLARHMEREDFAQLGELVAAQRAREGADPTGRLEFVTPERGAATQVWAAVTSALDGLDGVYLADCAVAEPAPYALDARRADLLWELSETMTAR